MSNQQFPRFEEMNLKKTKNASHIKYKATAGNLIIKMLESIEMEQEKKSPST